MLTDTQEFISNIIKKNISVYEKLIKTPDLKKYIGKNNKQQNNDNSNIKIIDSENNKANIIINKENNDKNNNNKIIINRINVINSNIGEETNRINKNDENSELKIIKKPKSGAFEEIRRNRTHFDSRKRTERIHFQNGNHQVDLRGIFHSDCRYHQSIQ